MIESSIHLPPFIYLHISITSHAHILYLHITPTGKYHMHYNKLDLLSMAVINSWSMLRVRGLVNQVNDCETAVDALNLWHFEVFAHGITLKLVVKSHIRNG
jgi:hypothetical protein